MNWFDLDGGAVTEDLGDALVDFGGVVTDADDGVGALGVGVVDHLAKGLVAGLLAQFGVNGDVAAEQALDARADVADDGAGAHDDAAHQSEIADDAVAIESESRGDHAVGNCRGEGAVGWRSAALEELSWEKFRAA